MSARVRDFNSTRLGHVSDVGWLELLLRDKRCMFDGPNPNKMMMMIRYHDIEESTVQSRGSESILWEISKAIINDKP